jgi:FKBP-type peptidyl-prolyl cis-trans isomerase
MKSPLVHGILMLLFGLGLGAGRAAGDTNVVPPASLPAFTGPQIVEAWGWMIAQDKGVAGIEISPNELAIFLRGFAANLHHRPAPAIRKNEAEAKAFFIRLKQKTNVVELPNGLCYEILKPGAGSGPKPAQTVNVHYFGHLMDGTEFAEFGPLDMILVTNHTVCRGWVEALQKFNRGTRAKLYVPPPLSEREAEGLGIEPGSALVFDLEVFDIKDTPPADLANATLPPAPESEPPLAEGITDRQLVEAWGWSVAQQTRAAEFNLGDSEIAALVKGLKAGIQAQPAPGDLQKIYPAVDRFVTSGREKVRAAARQQRLAERSALFDELKKNPNVIALPSGLRYEVVKPGRGPCPKPGQMVVVNFTGRLVDGTVFDRTDNEPLHIEVGSVTRGFNEGIQKINRGGRIKLYLPPELGFGDVAASSGVAGIPAGSTLIYDIELLEIKESSPNEGEAGKK